MRALLLLFVLLGLSNAYVSPMTYYIFGLLNTNWVYPNAQNTLIGLFTMTYNGATKALSYEITSNLQAVGNVELHGPAGCGTSPGNWYGLNDPRCIVNTGPVVYTFGTGRALTSTQTNFQTFKGTITLSQAEEEMLFNNELYILVYTGTMNGNTPVYTAQMRGTLSVYSYNNFYWPMYDSMPFFSGSTVFFVLNFQNNDGSFPGEATTNSQSLGHGILSFNTQNSNGQLWAYIFTTINTPGTYFLKCGSVVTSLNNGQNNPNPLNQNIQNFNTALYLEMLASKQCYVFITSSAYPNGDLFAWVQSPSNLDAFLTGAGETTPVQSPYFGRTTFTFDYGEKVLAYQLTHNVTSQITLTTIEFANGTMICNVTANPSWCYVNDSVVPYISGGQTYFNIYTQTNPTGELRGQIVFNAQAPSGSSLSSATLGPNNLAVGLGVGLGVGIPVVILLGVGIFFLAKKGGGSKL